MEDFLDDVELNGRGSTLTASPAQSAAAGTRTCTLRTDGHKA